MGCGNASARVSGMRSGRQFAEIKERLFTGVISDVLDALGRPDQVVDLDLTHVVPGGRVVGRAQTARAVCVSAPPAEPYKLLLTAIDATVAGMVLVVGADATSRSSLFGGLLATAVRAAGGEGVVVDGYARDVREIRNIGLPTMVRGFRPLDSYGRDEVVEISAPVTIGGVVIRQGDLIFGDDDGLVVVPSELEADVVERAFAKVDAEGEMRSALAGGMSVSDAFARFGVL
jgi:4-hydroxy-4-methyl-2-oxoglutarate aldolase